jgi:hypothetical protein
MTGNLLEATKESTDFSSKVSKITEGFELVTTDRCDRCSSQAYIEVSLSSGKLLFCAHHYKAQKDTLLPLPAVIKVRDESERLYLKPPATD